MGQPKDTPSLEGEAIEIVSATRLDAATFLAEAPLGLSLSRFSPDRRIQSRIFSDNAQGLPVVYNAAIDRTDGPDIVVFVHDDVWIEDIFLVERLIGALGNFDIVGVAGNTRRTRGQAAWYLDPDAIRWDFPHLSGAIVGRKPFGGINRFGSVPLACQSLDGVFLATRRSTLRRARVRFDTRFDFHFYDLDFCRAAGRAGLSLGTWPIVLAHRSEGNFESVAWERMRDVYFEKWGA